MYKNRHFALSAKINGKTNYHNNFLNIVCLCKLFWSQIVTSILISDFLYCQLFSLMYSL